MAFTSSAPRKRGGYAVTVADVDRWIEQLKNGVSVQEISRRSGYSVATIKRSTS